MKGEGVMPDNADMSPSYGYHLADNGPVRKRCPRCGAWMHWRGLTQEWLCSNACCGHEEGRQDRSDREKQSHP